MRRWDYRVTGSDISPGALAEARERARDAGLPLELREADFRRLPELVGGSYDIVIAMDNALPHLMSSAELAKAVGSIAGVTRPGGLFAASIRDYDALLETKNTRSSVNGPEGARRIAFQTWDWAGEGYRLVQYIIDETHGLTVSRHECEYRALRRAELTALLERGGLRRRALAGAGGDGLLPAHRRGGESIDTVNKERTMQGRTFKKVMAANRGEIAIRIFRPATTWG